MYEIKDTELEIFRRGSPADLQLNFAIFLLSLAFTAIVALYTAKFTNENVHTTFIVVAVAGILMGLYLIISWLRNRTSLTTVCDRIRERIKEPELIIRQTETSSSRTTVSVESINPAVADTEIGRFIGPDHNVRSNEKERSAAQSRGGTYSGGYICNHWGNGLRMGRALGDHELGRIVTKNPEMFVLKGIKNFLLIATDGVFDPGHSNTDNNIAAVVDLINQGADAQAIVDRAIKLDTGDNASAILVKF